MGSSMLLDSRPKTMGQTRVIFENQRLRVLDFRLPAGAEAVVKHKFPSVHWEVLDLDAPTPDPLFFETGSQRSFCNKGAEAIRAFIFEILQEPRYTEEEVVRLLAAAVYPTDVGTSMKLENRYCRMFDVRLEPGGGDKLDFHQHVLDNAFVMVTKSSLRGWMPTDDGGAMPCFRLDVPDGAVVWLPIENGGFDEDGEPFLGREVHSATNGRADVKFHEYLIELK